MSQNQVNKWMISKTGILNYWYYDEEEFVFENGHLLIRGGNGSGKSVTTQSFLPLLLDGNKSPQRLDPFGTRSRKMLDYVFGESPEETEKTSYLYMEYKKKDSDEYITTGIGLKGNYSNDKVDSWYFLIKNKRINEDIRLYNYQIDANGDRVKVPLSEKELKNLIEREKCGYYVTTQSEYAELVNSHIFKFATSQEFREMVDLIVRIRAPKLSNNMGPKVLYEVLQSSLPELNTNDLRSLSETIQNIDDIKERLEKAKYDLLLIKNLASKYSDYNFAVLAQKAEQFLSMQSKRTVAEKRVQKVQNDYDKSKRVFDEKQKEISNLDNELTVLSNKVEHLKENDVYKMKKELIGLEKHLTKVTQELQQQRESLRGKETRLVNVEKNIKQKEDEQYAAENQIMLSIEELDVIAEDVEYVAHALNRDAFKLSLGQQKALSSIQQWESNVEDFQSLVENILRYLEKESEIEQHLEAQRKLLSDEKQQYDGLLQQQREKQKELEYELEQLNRHIAKTNEQNQEFILTKDELALISYSIQELFETTSVKDVEQQLQHMFFSKKQSLGKEELHIDNEIRLLDKQMKEKKDEIEQWEKKTDPVPSFRKQETEKARRELLKNKVPFISFYEAVEFLPSVSEIEKERIESSLIEMGILDGLIVHPDFIHTVMDSDAVLLPKPISGTRTLNEYLSVNLPSEFQSLSDITSAILSSISIEENDEHSFVTSFGYYQHGIVKGYAIPRTNFIYIGKEARRQYREMMLQQLRSELEELMASKQELDIKLEEIKDRNKTLQNEFQYFVSFSGVEQIDKQIDTFERELASIKKSMDRVSEGIANLNQSFLHVKRKRMELIEGRETPLTIESYEMVVRDTKEYMKELRDMKQKVNNLSNVTQQLEMLLLQKNQAEEDVEETRDLTYQKEKEFNRVQLNVQELNKTIAEKDVGNIEQQIEETERRIQEIPGIRDSLNKEVGLLEGQIPTLETQILQGKSAVRFYQDMYDWAKELFVLEINRKLVETYDKDVLTVDEDMVALAEAVLEDDTNMSRESLQAIRDKLVASYNEVKLKGLEEFSPNFVDTDAYEKEVFNEGYEQFKIEIKNMQATSTRHLVQFTTDGKIESPQHLQTLIEEQIKIIEIGLTAEDEKLYKEVILDNIGERIRELISRADSWKEEINAYMKQTNASNGLKLWLQWKPKKAAEDEEMSTAELVRLLQKDPETLKDSDYRKLSKHFNSKISLVKNSYENDDVLREKSFDVLIKEILDYREWFEFKIYYQKEGEERRELTKTNYNTLSGGERAMSMYIPLLSALYSKFISASEEAPYIISMDEAFAGVDENNISTMFKLMSDFDMNYILNSQALWGTYETVDSLSIAEIIRPQNTKDVTVMLYRWNGNELKSLKEERIQVGDEQQSMFDMLDSMEVG